MKKINAAVLTQDQVNQIIDNLDETTKEEVSLEMKQSICELLIVVLEPLIPVFEIIAEKYKSQ